MVFLLHVLLTAIAFGALHVALSWRRPLPVIPFCAAAAGAHVVVGLLAWLPSLLGQAARSWSTGWWLPALCAGLFASGGVLGAAWVGAVKGIEILVRRRLGAGRPD